MIADYYNSKSVKFDGSKYYESTDDYFVGQNIETLIPLITTFYGVIHFSSKYSYKDNNGIKKPATIFIKNNMQILVNTKKTNQHEDMYALLKIKKIENKCVICDVLKYIENNYEFEKDFVKLMCLTSWTGKKILKEFEILKSIDLTPNREILKDIEIYTIDPKGCIDIDDALHCRKLENNQYEVGIHIADVSSYIQENSIVDNELKKRVETLYSNEIEHMIPEILSINCMSLLENEEKRAFSIIIVFDEKYKIISISFKKLLICVKKNLSYDEAQEMVNTNDNLKLLYDIGKQLMCENNEYDIHKMVEIYMIYANKIVAEKIQKFDHQNVLLRVNNNKTIKNIKCDNLKLIEKYKINLSEQAKYQIGSENAFHNGLGINYYTYFTSPIRRYADILVHRQLWNVLNNVKLEKPQLEAVFLMNFCERYNKQIQRYNKIAKISENIKNNEIYIGYITYFCNENLMKIHIPELDLDISHQIYDDKIKDVISVELINEINNEKIIIKNNQTKNEIILKLFQEINVKISVSKTKIVKLYTEIDLFNVCKI